MRDSGRSAAEDVDFTFAARLNRLFDCVYPPGQPRYRDADVVAGVRSLGFSISRAYLSQLRSGRRTQPTDYTIEGLAAFFRVDIRYFSDDQYYQSLNDELTLLARPRNDAVARLAIRVASLPQNARREILQAINQLHRDT